MTDRPDRIEQRARHLQQLANDRIAAEHSGWHWLEYRARAEMIAEEIFGPEWEWQVVEALGAPPTIVLLAYADRRRTYSPASGKA